MGSRCIPDFIFPGYGGIQSLPMLQIVPSWLCNAVDTTGAGDVFHGAFTYGVHYSWHIDNIILFASLTAAISIEKKGVRESMPDLAVVHHSLNSYERNLTQYFEE